MSSKNFTLVELLVVIAIIGLLVTLLLPSLRQARDKSRSAVCLSNTRQSGFFIHSSIRDQDYNHYISSHVGRPAWSSYLRDRYDAPMDVLSCIDYCTGSPWNAYGSIYSGHSGGKYNLRGISEPSKFRMIADTYSESRKKSHFRWATSFRNRYLSLIHFRHVKRANVLFLDGHAKGHTTGTVNNAVYSRRPWDELHNGFDRELRKVSF